MIRKKQRFIFIIISLMLISLIFGLIFFIIKDNISFFKTPTEILLNKLDIKKRLRIGGLVIVNSIKNENHLLKFQITDNKITLNVEYKGIVPDLFKEGQWVIIEGYLNLKKIFLADSLLAKHDENYTPKKNE